MWQRMANPEQAALSRQRDRSWKTAKECLWQNNSGHPAGSPLEFCPGKAVLSKAVLWGLLLVLGCSPSAPGESYEAVWLRFDLASSPAVVAFPPLEQVRDEFLSLVVNTEGLDGVLDYFRQTMGVDIAREDFFRDSGLDAGMAPVLFQWEEGWVWAMGVSDSRRFQRWFQERPIFWESAVVPLHTPQAVLVPLSTTLACAWTGNLWILMQNRHADPLASLSRLLLSSPPSSPRTPPDDRVFLRVNPETGRRDHPRGWINALGPGAGVVHGMLAFVDSCLEVEGTVSLGHRWEWDILASGCRVPGGRPSKVHPEEWLPEDSIWLLQGSLPGGRMEDSLPGWIRRWLSHPDAPPLRWRGAEFPLARWISCVGTDLHLAFLGFSRTVSIDELLRPRDLLNALFAVHLQLGLSLHCPEVWEELAGEGGALFQLAGFDVSRCVPDEDTCVEGCRREAPDRCFSVLYRDEQLWFNTGQGEGNRTLQGLAGNRPSLARGLFVQQKRGSFTLTLKTRRLVRDLINKGFPPYFLQMLASLMELRITISPEGEGTRVWGEVVWR